MLSRRERELISAGVDGELDAAGREELEQLLASSQEARRVHSELLRVVQILGTVPEVEPPPGLASRVLARYRPPEFASTGSVSGILSRWLPAAPTLAFAAGLLVAVGVYEISGDRDRPGDIAAMVGSMIADPQARAVNSETMVLRGAGLSARVTRSRGEEFEVLTFDFDSSDAVNIQIDFSAAGLEFSGLARSPGGNAVGSESFEVSGGTLRVVNQGRQTLSVFFREPIPDEKATGNISILVSAAGQRVVEAVVE